MCVQPRYRPILQAIALVSDAGMPAISDPGYIIVSAAVAAGVTVVPIPGPCAAVTALAAAGLPIEAFYFAGFLPPKAGKRKAALLQVMSVSRHVVLSALPGKQRVDGVGWFVNVTYQCCWEEGMDMSGRGVQVL